MSDVTQQLREGGCPMSDNNALALLKAERERHAKDPRSSGNACAACRLRHPCPTFTAADAGVKALEGLSDQHAKLREQFKRDRADLCIENLAEALKRCIRCDDANHPGEYCSDCVAAMQACPRCESMEVYETRYVEQECEISTLRARAEAAERENAELKEKLERVRADICKHNRRFGLPAAVAAELLAILEAP